MFFRHATAIPAQPPRHVCTVIVVIFPAHGLEFTSEPFAHSAGVVVWVATQYARVRPALVIVLDLRPLADVHVATPIESVVHAGLLVIVITTTVNDVVRLLMLLCVPPVVRLTAPLGRVWRFTSTPPRRPSVPHRLPVPLPSFAAVMRVGPHATPSYLVVDVSRTAPCADAHWRHAAAVQCWCTAHCLSGPVKVHCVGESATHLPNAAVPRRGLRQYTVYSPRCVPWRRSLVSESFAAGSAHLGWRCRSSWSYCYHQRHHVITWWACYLDKEDE